MWRNVYADEPDTRRVGVGGRPSRRRIPKSAEPVRNTSGLKRGGPGRPKGRKDDKTLEAEAFSRSILSDDLYRADLLSRAQTGRLAPATETMLWAYGWGKPKERVELTGENSGPLQVLFGGRFKPDA